jgi:peptide methionine sulfoxide reductase MsrA
LGCTGHIVRLALFWCWQLAWVCQRNKIHRSLTLNTEARTQSIVLGGGCFWCLDAVYVNVQGVQLVESGYSNGTVARPSYEQVCGGNTGHAEVVKLVFDPQVISLREILEIFFVIHDPTTLNAQGMIMGPSTAAVSTIPM